MGETYGLSDRLGLQLDGPGGGERAAISKGRLGSLRLAGEDLAPGRGSGGGVKKNSSGVGPGRPVVTINAEEDGDVAGGYLADKGLPVADNGSGFGPVKRMLGGIEFVFTGSIFPPRPSLISFTPLPMCGGGPRAPHPVVLMLAGWRVVAQMPGGDGQERGVERDEVGGAEGVAGDGRCNVVEALLVAVEQGLAAVVRERREEVCVGRVEKLPANLARGRGGGVSPAGRG